MANGGNLLEDVGTIIAPNISSRLQRLNDRRQERGALDQLLKLNPPSPIDRQDLSVGTNAPGSVMADLIKPPERFQQETQDYRSQVLPLAKKLAPEAFAQSILSGLLPKPPEEYTLGENQVRMRGSEQIGAGPKSAPKIPDILVPGVLEAEIKKAMATRAPDERWTPLGAEQAKALGLDPNGTYQVNNKGQVSVITQPKQTNPTEAQQKYGYNAKRIAASATAIQKALAEDPTAVTSGALEATQDNPVPGIPWLGRKVTNENQQIVRNNMGGIIDAALTLGTGAAYNQEQLDAARAELMPRAGEGEKVISDKFDKLMALYDQARQNAHAAGVDLPDPAFLADVYKPKKAEQPQAQAAVGGRVPAQPKPASAPPEAKQAPDGNWYTPDPARPGKFLKW